MLKSIQQFSKPFDSYTDLDSLVNQIGDAQYVLLGESSHGTSEFYTIRAELSKRLIQEKGFSVIAVEGDWPACQQINQYIKGWNHSQDAGEVLTAFSRWPTWMWANQEILHFMEWIKTHNKTSQSERKVGFYGIDIYSLWESMDEVLSYLKKINSPDLDLAKRAFSCFEPFQRNHEKYAVSAALFSDGCIDEVSNLLKTIQNSKISALENKEAELDLQVNTLVTANAEKYYRMMMLNDAESWNIRDLHMVEAINTVKNFHGKDTKIIVWEHNTHIGDARATDMKNEGMINVGQIIREQNPKDSVYIVGFGTHHGTVIAAEEWGENLEVMKVPPAQEGSWEDLLHKASAQNQILFFTEENRRHFSQIIGHRAIGVVYRPELEQYGNYVPSSMSERYDAFIFIDETKALIPLVLEGIPL